MNLTRLRLTIVAATIAISPISAQAAAPSEQLQISAASLKIAISN